MRPWWGLSRTLIVNSLCTAIGALLAVNISIIYPHRHALYRLWEDFLRCVTGDLR